MRTQRTPAGFTLIELLVVMGIVAVLATAGMMAYRQSRIRAAEGVVISSLAALNQAQFLYMQTCGRQRYAPTLVALGTPAPGDEHGFVSTDLAVSDPLLKHGYLIELSGTPASEGEQTCTGTVPLTSYKLTADPTTPGVTGNQFYGTNGERVIYGDVATFQKDMPETGAPGHGQEIK